ncbi:WSSV129 [White spot syndrome virus]|uniref:WSSV129 n=1 Tax=White spot syndrome virus TaxID=342409 RepID=A0A2I6SBQ0_9VIRU|nr:WSSV129 [White spot syndrome virus]
MTHLSMEEKFLFTTFVSVTVSQEDFKCFGPLTWERRTDSGV